MANGFLNISHNFAGNTFNYLIVEWVKSTAQATPVVGHVTGTNLGGQNDTDATEVNYPAPFINEQLQVINLPEVWFLVRFWSSPDGTTKDQLLIELAGNARTGALYPVERFEYVVDRGWSNTSPVVTEGVWSDPVQDDTGLRDTRLADQLYWIEERGTGSLIAAEYTDRSDVGGGFDFTEVGKVMNSGAVYVVYVLTRVDLAGDDSGSGAVGAGDCSVFILNADQDYNPVTMNGRTLIANFSTTVGQLNIPNLLLVADSCFKVQTHGGMQRNVRIQFDAGDTIKFRGEDVNEILLGQSEEIHISIIDNTAYIINHNTNHFRLGQVVWSYKELLNGLKADGSLLALADYPRVEELINSLPASSVVSEITWQTTAAQSDGQTVAINKGKWMSDGVNFRPPDLRDRMLKALTALDGSVASGRYEHQALMNHKHYITGGADNLEDGEYLAETHSTGGNLGYNLYGSTVAPTKHKTGDPVTVGSADQKVDNIGLYPIICI